MIGTGMAAVVGPLTVGLGALTVAVSAFATAAGSVAALAILAFPLDRAYLWG